MAVNQDIKRITERIKFENNLNQSEIADKINVSATYLSDIINGRSPVNDTFLAKIRKTFGLKENEISEENPTIIRDHTFYGSDDPDSLPLIPFDCVAGFPGGPDDDSAYLSQCDRYSVPEFTAKKADFLIRVSGQSMTPTFNNGDLLACRKIDEITFFQWGNVYVLDTNQGVLVKRLFEDKDDETKIICKSDNVDAFPEFVINKDDIRSLSIVCGMIRME